MGLAGSMVVNMVKLPVTGMPLVKLNNKWLQKPMRTSVAEVLVRRGATIGIKTKSSDDSHFFIGFYIVYT